MSIKCSSCGYPNPDTRSTCFKCNQSLVVQAPPMQPQQKAAPIVARPIRIKMGPRNWVLAGIGLILGIAFFFGHYHIVSSSERSTMIIPKMAFTFKETFIVVDEITGMPFVEARKKYPLSVKALQREGILETDEQFEARIKYEVEQEMRREQEKIDREIEVERQRIDEDIRRIMNTPGY